ncbi:MAG TPA: DHA2 family efflux MFS transporter permease subunit [Acidobacteriaceae bacterium]|jgi:DHA2 family multidrug resistance protein|nr:DHA2 family efflux MFS transporter permease subunit [Acidobacteriaceae bacterium]
MATLVESPVYAAVADAEVLAPPAIGAGGGGPPMALTALPAAMQVGNPWVVAISVMLATFMEVLDTAIASVALPYIAGSLAASNSEATWVLTSYLIANAVVLPASNWFALRFGRKRFLITCVVIFTIASFWCGAAPTLGMLLLARVLQGAGGGALQPLSQAILLESFPPKKRGAAMALFGFGVVVAPVLGPTLGGWLTDSFSWRYAFYINIPVGILAVFMISRFVKDPPYIRNAKAGPFDNLGFALLCLWSGSLQVILDKGQEDGWFGAPWLRWAVVILAVSLTWFIWHSWTTKRPLVNLKILVRNRNFGVGCLLVFMLGIAIYVTVAILPLFYQEVLGYTALTAGIVVAPRGLGSMLGLPVVGMISHRVDNRWLLCAGFAVFGVCSILFSWVNLGISPTTLLIPIMVTGFALSFVFVPIATMATTTLTNEQMGNATGIFNLLRNIGGSIGISMAETALIRRESFHQSMIAASAPRTGLWFELHMAQSSAYFGRALGHAAGQPAALAAMYMQLERQAMLWSFVDVFRWTALIAFAAGGMVWLFRRVR